MDAEPVREEGLGNEVRWLAWLSTGARSLDWALEACPPSAWDALPPAALGSRSVADHARHLVEREVQQYLPALREALAGPAAGEPALPAGAGDGGPEALVRRLAEARFEALRLVEQAGPEALGRSEQAGAERWPARVLAEAYQHELAHLSAIWRLTLWWVRAERRAGADRPAAQNEQGEE